jgi:hypothetical protein
VWTIIPTRAPNGTPRTRTAAVGTEEANRFDVPFFGNQRIISVIDGPSTKNNRAVCCDIDCPYRRVDMVPPHDAAAVMTCDDPSTIS